MCTKIGTALWEQRTSRRRYEKEGEVGKSKLGADRRIGAPAGRGSNAGSGVESESSPICREDKSSFGARLEGGCYGAMVREAGREGKARGSRSVTDHGAI